MKMMSSRVCVLAVASVLAACAARQETQQPLAHPSEGSINELEDRSQTSVAHDPAHPEPAITGPAITGPAQPVEAPQFHPREADLAKAANQASQAYPATEHRVAHKAMQTFIAPAPCCMPYPLHVNTENYQHLDDNPVKLAAEHPVSTFSIDVDTGAYANVRRFLSSGSLPPQDAVRIEEMLNYFDYQYTAPSSRDTPFSVATEVANAPWNDQALLMRIGIKGFEIDPRERPPANLVFLVDVSGSMQSPDKLPLLKSAFALLVDQLSARDRVSMVVYAGSSGVVLEPTPGDQKRKILDALHRLEAGGSTNGAAGITRAYQLAREAHIRGGINRVVLATDGDFNVGVVDFEQLIDMAERERTSGVALTTLGFGTGNYNDELIERLADAGDGNYAYIDNLSEARKVLVSELSSTLMTIAKDVKIQVEFNPAQVLEYRLIGYENRMLAREDFNNDKVDAGEIGAGHRVTALYEVIPVGAKGRVDTLRYGQGSLSPTVPSAASSELAHVRLRYKAPEGEVSKLIEYPILKSSVKALTASSLDFRFAASVAGFGQLLRGGKYSNEFGYRDVASLARQSVGPDRDGYRREFLALVDTAAALSATGNKDDAIAREGQ